MDVMSRDAYHHTTKQNLKDLEYAREGLEIAHVDKKGRGSGGGDHPVYGDLGGHPVGGAAS